MNNPNGMVYLIGAGPGDPDLITVKGKKLLQQCDVVLYDKLIPDELVTLLPENVERFYVGKKADHHFLNQEEINTLMVKLAREGKKVARLKGGDPLIFGRGGEEAHFLRRHQIPFVLVPGVTAAIGSMTCNLIPCTDRRSASFILFVTGHKSRSDLAKVPWEWIAQTQSGTIVIYMGVGEIANIVERLRKNGMSAQMPAAIVERGTFPSQRTIISTLEELPQAVTDNKIQPPALFILGKAVSLYLPPPQPEQPVFAATRMLVTAANLEAQSFYQDLRLCGIEVYPYPTITVAKHHDDNWQQVADLAADNRWLLFSSEFAAKFFMQQLADNLGDIRALAQYKIAAASPATQQTLHNFHLCADVVFSDTTTIEQIQKYQPFANSMVVYVYGEDKDEMTCAALGQSGAKVLPLCVYRAQIQKWSPVYQEKLVAHPPNLILFSSPREVDGLLANVAEDVLKKITASTQIIAVGPQTMAAVNKRGFTTISQIPTQAAFVNTNFITWQPQHQTTC